VHGHVHPGVQKLPTLCANTGLAPRRLICGAHWPSKYDLPRGDVRDAFISNCWSTRTAAKNMNKG